MTGRELDKNVWPGADQFKLFRTFEKPHYVIVSRVDVTRLKASRHSEFRSVLWAIGAGINAVDALRTRFVGDVVTQYDDVQISMTLPLEDGSFGFGYIDWENDHIAFDKNVARIIEQVQTKGSFEPNLGRPSVVYASCIPWLDFTGLDNALPSIEDCIPRISWGKIVEKGDGFDMAMAIQVHHALVDGRQIGRFFDGVKAALDSI